MSRSHSQSRMVSNMSQSQLTNPFMKNNQPPSESVGNIFESEAPRFGPSGSRLPPMQSSAIPVAIEPANASLYNGLPIEPDNESQYFLNKSGGGNRSVIPVPVLPAQASQYEFERRPSNKSTFSEISESRSPNRVYGNRSPKNVSQSSLQVIPVLPAHESVVATETIPIPVVTSETTTPVPVILSQTAHTTRRSTSPGTSPRTAAFGAARNSSRLVGSPSAGNFASYTQYQSTPQRVVVQGEPTVSLGSYQTVGGHQQSINSSTRDARTKTLQPIFLQESTYNKNVIFTNDGKQMLIPLNTSGDRKSSSALPHQLQQLGAGPYGTQSQAPIKRVMRDSSRSKSPSGGRGFVPNIFGT